jgi:hypothetical protein
VLAAHARTAGAAEHLAVGLDAVTDNAAIAMVAMRRERMDGAFKRIERHGLSGGHDLERLVIVIAANIAFHEGLLSKANGDAGGGVPK